MSLTSAAAVSGQVRMARTFVVACLAGLTPAGPGGYLRWTSDVVGVAWYRRNPYAGGLGVGGVAASPSGPDANWRMARGMAFADDRAVGHGVGG